MIANSYLIAKKRCREWKKANKIVVVTQGVFDLLHYAHIEYLAIAAKQGGKLIVAVDSNKKVRLRKGPGRPVHNWIKRASRINALGFIDIVFPKHHLISNMFYITNIKPDVLIVSDDTDFDDNDIKILSSRRIFVVCAPRDPTISTTLSITERHNSTQQ